MGKRKSGEGLLKLGLKKPKPWVYHNAWPRMDESYHELRKLKQMPDSTLIRVRDYRRKGEIVYVPEKQVTLEQMGLRRLENGRIVDKSFIEQVKDIKVSTGAPRKPVKRTPWLKKV